MIIVIILLSIFGLLFIVTISCLIDYLITGKYVTDEVMAWLAGITTFFGIITAIPCFTCIGINQTSSIKAKEYELIETINLYQYDKQVLESYHLVNDADKASFTSDITLEVVSTVKYYEMVRDYNNKVFKFKYSIKNEQYKRDNPWISWFVNEGYKSISDEQLNQLEYTPGR